MKGMIPILFLITISWTCTQKQENNKSLENGRNSGADTGGLPNLFENANDTSYYKAEIYCWCFGGIPLYRKKDGSTVVKGQFCETPVRINATDLIMPERLFISVTDKSSVNKLKDLFLKRADSINQISYDVDSRFLILLRSDRHADTLNYYIGDEFILNDKYRLKYSINIFDSISKILLFKNIMCPSVHSK